MNRRQKRLLTESITVTAITVIAVLAMINLKDWVNRSEALRAMSQLGIKVLEYRQAYGSLPSESYVKNIIGTLEGHLRLGKLQYRAQWIDFEATPDEILAYSEKRYPSSLLEDVYIVLRLDGRVEWIGTKEFEELLARQQSPIEIEMMQ